MTENRRLDNITGSMDMVWVELVMNWEISGVAVHGVAEFPDMTGDWTDWCWFTLLYNINQPYSGKENTNLYVHADPLKSKVS